MWNQDVNGASANDQSYGNDGNGNSSWSSAWGSDVQHDTTGAGWRNGVAAGLTGGVPAYYRMAVGQRRHRKAGANARASALAAQLARDANARQAAYDARRQWVRGLQKQQDDYRTGALTSLEKGYGMDARHAQHEQYYQDSLNSMLADAGQQYGVALDQAGGNAAARGVLGGSNYAEAQAGLGNTLRSQAVDATQQAYGTLNDQNQADLSEYSNLRNSIQAGNPQSADAYSAYAQNDNNAANRAMQQVGFQNAYQNLGMQGANNQSQMYGAWGNAAAQGVHSYYGNSGGAY